MSHTIDKTLKLADHKPVRRLTAAQRRSYLESCQMAHTLAQRDECTYYLNPTIYGWTLATEPYRFASYVSVDPAGICTEYTFNPMEA